MKRKLLAKSKSVNADDILSLLRRVTEGATGNDMPISELLRLCLRLAGYLENKELSTWAQSELNGYKKQDEIPSYRHLGTQVRGNFSGWGGSSYRNASIPPMVVEDDHREWLFSNKIAEPIATIAELAAGDMTEPLQSPWHADIVAYYQQKEIYEGYVLNEAWKLVSRPAMAGIIDTVRTRILEFVLQIEQTIDIQNSDDKSDPEVTKPSSEVVSQIVNNTFYGDNVSVGNTGTVTQTSIQVQPGDFKSLKRTLKSLGITEELIEELETALEKDKTSRDQPGPATSSWLSRLMIMIGRGSLSVSSDAVGSLVATAIMKFLGISTAG